MARSQQRLVGYASRCVRPLAPKRRRGTAPLSPRSDGRARSGRREVRPDRAWSARGRPIERAAADEAPTSFTREPDKARRWQTSPVSCTYPIGCTHIRSGVRPTDSYLLARDPPGRRSRRHAERRSITAPPERRPRPPEGRNRPQAHRSHRRCDPPLGTVGRDRPPPARTPGRPPSAKHAGTPDRGPATTTGRATCRARNPRRPRATRPGTDVESREAPDRGPGRGERGATDGPRDLRRGTRDGAGQGGGGNNRDRTEEANQSGSDDKAQ